MRGQLILREPGFEEFHDGHGLLLHWPSRPIQGRCGVTAGTAGQLWPVPASSAPGSLGSKLAPQLGHLGLELQHAPDRWQRESFAGQAGYLLDAVNLGAAVAPLPALRPGRLDNFLGVQPAQNAGWTPRSCATWPTV